MAHRAGGADELGGPRRASGGGRQDAPARGARRERARGRVRAALGVHSLVRRARALPMRAAARRTRARARRVRRVRRKQAPERGGLRARALRARRPPRHHARLRRAPTHCFPRRTHAIMLLRSNHALLMSDSDDIDDIFE